MFCEEIVFLVPTCTNICFCADPHTYHENLDEDLEATITISTNSSFGAHLMLFFDYNDHHSAH